MKTCIQNLFVALVMLIGQHHAAAQTLFAPAVNYAVGDGPSCVVATDINNDGKLDLICANSGRDFGNTITILTNDGAGIFVSNTTYTVGIGPYWLVAADVNGDGKVDLIVANQGEVTNPPFYPSTLMVLTNNGSGVFGSNATYNVGTRAVQVLAVDVNGDGKLDLISANENANTLTVLTNDGNGIFVSNATYNVGNSPGYIVAADVNRDGKVDLISANNLDSTLTVLTNNGSGVFGSNATYSAGMSLSSIVAADVNGNGGMDLICVNPFANALTVLTNNGSGFFGSNATYTVENPYSILAADVNGDGRLDLVCTGGNASDKALTVLTNNGNSGFATSLTNTVSDVAHFVLVADVNGDGKLDLISANFFTNTLSVLLNTSIFPSPTFTPTLNINPSGNKILVSWSSASAGWSLRQTSDLTTSNWSPSGYSGYNIADDGTNKSLVVAPPTENLFFRLLHP